MKNKYITRHKSGQYQIMIWYNGKHNYHGIYKTLPEAIKVRDEVLLKLGNLANKYNSYYFDNKEMYKEIVYSKAVGKLSNKLMFELLKIVKGVSKKFRYNDEDDRLDCEAYACEIIIKNWYQFDEDKYDNVFSYFTEIIKRAFSHQWKQLQKSRINTISLNYTDAEGNKIINI